MSTPRHPSSSDEELLEAETTAILAELTDAQRLLRIQDELRAGFAQLAHIGKAVSIFGSARTPRDDPRYAAAPLGRMRCQANAPHSSSRPRPINDPTRAIDSSDAMS